MRNSSMGCGFVTGGQSDSARSQLSHGHQIRRPSDSSADQIDHLNGRILSRGLRRTKLSIKFLPFLKLPLDSSGFAIWFSGPRLSRAPPNLIEPLESVAHGKICGQCA